MAFQRDGTTTLPTQEVSGMATEKVGSPTTPKQKPLHPVADTTPTQGASTVAPGTVEPTTELVVDPAVSAR